MALELTPEDFEALVVEQLDALPDDMVSRLDNVVFVVEDRPDNGENLLGSYDGVALTERGTYGFGELPDRIVVYRDPLLELCEDLEHLTEEIRITLVHEIAHYYGIDEETLHSLGWG